MKETIIITGSSGFIGTELTQQLLDESFKVIGLDLEPPKRDFKGSFEFRQVDLTSAESSKFFPKSSALIHLASKIGGVRYMEAHPVNILEENVKMFLNTFSGLRVSKTKRIIYASSSMVYQKTKLYPVKETDALATPLPSNIYGVSKLIGETFCKAYQKEFNIDYTIMRIFNAYGKNEYLGERSHVIADLTRKILSGQYPLELWGSPNATRSFTHVSDIAYAFVLAVKNSSTLNQDYNVGNSQETKIIDLAQKIWLLCGRNKTFKAEWFETEPDTAIKRSLDVSKLLALGWKPKVTLDKGLPEVVEWLKKEYK